MYGRALVQQRGVFLAAQVGLEVPHKGRRGPRARALRRPAGPGARPRSAQDAAHAALRDDAAAQQGALVLLSRLGLLMLLVGLLLLLGLLVAPSTAERPSRFGRLGAAGRLKRGALLAKGSATAVAVDAVGHGDTHGALHVDILFLESAVSRQREAA